VKVVPPDEAGPDGLGERLVWDGSSSWVVPSANSAAHEERSATAKGKGKRKESAEVLQQRAARTRADAMLQQLKRDPDAMKEDPSADENLKNTYELWSKEEVESKEGGIDGSFWTDRIKTSVEEKVDGEALCSTRDALVPSVIDAQTFWTRYFFRIYLIEKEEEKRKELLAAGAPEGEEDFSWEDEEEEDSVTPPVGHSVQIGADSSTLKPTTAAANTTAEEKPVSPSDAGSLATTPATISPRESSEDSYDVLSSGSVQAETGKKEKSASGEKDEEDEEADSDWE